MNNVNKIHLIKANAKDISAIIDAADNLSAMVGGGDGENDDEFKKVVKQIDRFLKRNKLKRQYT